MDIRVLGCSGGIGGPDNRTTSLLVDDDVLIDCGTGVGTLSFEQLLKIDHVFITHSHLDHIALLPLLVDTVGEFRTRPIIVHASEETVRILRSHIFNWLVWPDFTAIPDRDHPFLCLQPLSVGETLELGKRRITAVPALHAVPAVGYRLTGAAGSLVFSGDTTLCDALVDALNAMRDLRYFIVETAFPDAEHDLALAARHLCPSMLRVLLGRLVGTPEVFVTHLKPGMVDQITSELQTGFARLRPGLLHNDQIFSL
ncbi:MAG: class cyclic nucleotide phosphodiesterase [Rhodocyclales bacterium]|nr:class cyclic nucleotide phosphodiesterase [Rhodocyclales bacterium]MDB5887262.1 class cyclic nucleotide phosphodiesterase [Rhodocyclales bacterium]